MRLFDADEARNGIAKHFIDYADDATPEQVGFNEGLGVAIDELDSQPTAEVVHCRDCKWYNLHNKTAGFCYHPKHDTHGQGGKNGGSTPESSGCLILKRWAKPYLSPVKKPKRHLQKGWAEMMDAVILFVIGVMILMLACFLAGFILCAKMNNEAITGNPRQNFLRTLFGWCPHCGRWLCRGVKRRRQNTAYEDEESNYITVCRECFDEIQEMWNERWDEYWSSRL